MDFLGRAGPRYCNPLLAPAALSLFITHKMQHKKTYIIQIQHTSTEYHLEIFELILTLYCLSLKNTLIHSVIILGKPKDATLFIKRL